MEINTNKIGQDILKWTVVGGSAVIAVNSVMQLFKSTSVKSAIMPAVTLLVGVSAFSYAMTAKKISLVPELKSSVRGLVDSGGIFPYSSRGINRKCPDGSIVHISQECPTKNNESVFNKNY